MAVLNQITVGEAGIYYVDADPSSDGFTSVKGSIAFRDNGTIYIKWGDGDTDWNLISSNFALFSSTTIDGKSTGSTVIGTTRSNGSERFYTQIAQIFLVSSSGIVTPPTISIGSNSASYNNIITDTLLSGLNTNNDFYGFTATGVIPSLAGGTEIKVNISSGANATTYNIIALVRGFYA